MTVEYTKITGPGRQPITANALYLIVHIIHIYYICICYIYYLYKLLYDMCTFIHELLLVAETVRKTWRTPQSISQSWEKAGREMKTGTTAPAVTLWKAQRSCGNAHNFVYACAQIPEVVKQSNLGYPYGIQVQIVILLKLPWTAKHLRGKWVSGLRTALWNNSIMTPFTKSDLP